MNDARPSPRPWWARLYLWAAERLYAELAWSYDLVSWCVSLGHWDGWRRQALHYIPPQARILEIGFGTGELLCEMARRGWDIWGLDLSPKMQRITARKLRRRGLRAPCIQAPTQAMPFAAGSFDILLSTFPAPYIAAPATLNEAYRLLRPGGRLIIAGTFFKVDDHRLHPLLQLVFGGPHNEERFHSWPAAEAAGFQLTIDENPPAQDNKKPGAVRLPILILEKKEL